MGWHLTLNGVRKSLSDKDVVVLVRCLKDAIKYDDWPVVVYADEQELKIDKEEGMKIFLMFTKGARA